LFKKFTGIPVQWWEPIKENGKGKGAALGKKILKLQMQQNIREYRNPVETNPAQNESRDEIRETEENI
jgi:hypothetical protein